MGVPYLRFKQEDDSDYSDWEDYTFDELFASFPNKQYQLQTKDYHKTGKYPIIDQGQDYLAGYTDVETVVCYQIPAIIFGDHTTIVKYINKPFAVGADGVKTLTTTLNNPKYAYYLLSANAVSPEGYKRHFSIQKEKLLLTAISIDEQNKIADFLSNIDLQIENYQKSLVNLEAQKAELLRQVFSQELQFTKEDGSEYPEWEEDTLGHYVKITSGKSPTGLLSDKGTIPYFKVDQLNYTSKYLCDTPYYINYTENNVVSKGCIIFPKRGEAIFQNKIRILAQDSFMDTNLMTLACRDCNNEYLYYYLCANDLSQIADTTTVPQINNKHINPYSIQLPCLEEQQKIADFFSDFDKRIELERQRLQAMQELKKGLLQQMFC